MLHGIDVASVTSQGEFAYRRDGTLVFDDGLPYAGPGAKDSGPGWVFGGGGGGGRRGGGSDGGKDDAPPTLTFESRFESGNLRKVVQTGPREYDLTLRADRDSNHVQWYYFYVAGTRAGAAYTFNLVNFVKPKSLYNQGLRPLLYSSCAAQVSGVGWRRAGTRVAYFRAGQRHTLTFTVTFDHDNDKCFFAHCYPYTFTDAQMFLTGLHGDRARAATFTRATLCRSLAGNAVDVICISDPPVPLAALGKDDALPDLGGRECVLLTARVHPGETQASWAMQGALDFLTSDCAEARRLRARCVFFVIPMLNPDGVIDGHYRCSLAGQDLNRVWGEPDAARHPEIWHAKDLARRLARAGLRFFCDFHGHSVKRHAFMYGCEPTRDPACRFNPQVDGAVGGAAGVFPRMLSEMCEAFSLPDCDFKVQRSKHTTGRVVVCRELAVQDSYTFEVSFLGGTAGADLVPYHFNLRDIQALGAHFARALLRYLPAPPGEEPLKHHGAAPQTVGGAQARPSQPPPLGCWGWGPTRAIPYGLKIPADSDSDGDGDGRGEFRLPALKVVHAVLPTDALASQPCFHVLVFPLFHVSTFAASLAGRSSASSTDRENDARGDEEDEEEPDDGAMAGAVDAAQGGDAVAGHAHEGAVEASGDAGPCSGAADTQAEGGAAAESGAAVRTAQQGGSGGELPTRDARAAAHDSIEARAAACIAVAAVASGAAGVSGPGTKLSTPPAGGDSGGGVRERALARLPSGSVSKLLGSMRRTPLGESDVAEPDAMRVDGLGARAGWAASLLAHTLGPAPTGSAPGSSAVINGSKGSSAVITVSSKAGRVWPGVAPRREREPGAPLPAEPRTPAGGAATAAHAAATPEASSGGAASARPPPIAILSQADAADGVGAGEGSGLAPTPPAKSRSPAGDVHGVSPLARRSSSDTRAEPPARPTAARAPSATGALRGALGGGAGECIVADSGTTAGAAEGQAARESKVTAGVGTASPGRDADDAGGGSELAGVRDATAMAPAATRAPTAGRASPDAGATSPAGGSDGASPPGQSHRQSPALGLSASAAGPSEGREPGAPAWSDGAALPQPRGGRRAEGGGGGVAPGGGVLLRGKSEVHLAKVNPDNFVPGALHVSAVMPFSSAPAPVRGLARDGAARGRGGQRRHRGARGALAGAGGGEEGGVAARLVAARDLAARSPCGEAARSPPIAAAPLLDAAVAEEGGGERGIRSRASPDVGGGMVRRGARGAAGMGRRTESVPDGGAAAAPPEDWLRRQPARAASNPDGRVDGCLPLVASAETSLAHSSPASAGPTGADRSPSLGGGPARSHPEAHARSHPEAKLRPPDLVLSAAQLAAWLPAVAPRARLPGPAPRFLRLPPAAGDGSKGGSPCSGPPPLPLPDRPARGGRAAAGRAPHRQVPLGGRVGRRAARGRRRRGARARGQRPGPVARSWRADRVAPGAQSRARAPRGRRGWRRRAAAQPARRSCAQCRGRRAWGDAVARVRARTGAPWGTAPPCRARASAAGRAGRGAAAPAALARGGARRRGVPARAQAARRPAQPGRTGAARARAQRSPRARRGIAWHRPLGAGGHGGPAAPPRGAHRPQHDVRRHGWRRWWLRRAARRPCRA